MQQKPILLESHMALETHRVISPLSRKNFDLRGYELALVEAL
jgi:hypothetical protein